MARDYMAELEDESEPVHGWFELSYSSYFTIPRSVLEAMPVEWQRKFIALVNEMNDTLDWGTCLPIPMQDRYTVYLRDGAGRFLRDPLANYRHPIPIPLKSTKPENQPAS